MLEPYALSRSRRLFERARGVIPSGVNSPVRLFEPYPFFVRRAEGSRIWDVDGRQMVDMCNGYGALLLGHRRREIIRAVSEQLERGALYCAPTDKEVVLSELIAGNYPSMEKVRLVNTGGEATMTAIRLARGHTGRKKIVMFEGCYHGAHDSVLVKAGSGLAHSGISASEGGLAEVSRNTLVARYNDLGSVEAILEGNESVAGVIIEPIMANMGLITPKKGFLARVGRLARKNGSLLIFDEVVTGFRVSPGGAQGYFGMRPDITTLAKALGNGFAIAAVGGRRDVMDNLAPEGGVYQASTFAGNPVSVSAAVASVRAMNRMRNRLYPRLERICSEFSKALGDMAADMGIRHQINSVSSMMQIFFSDRPVTDYASSMAADAAKFRRLFARLLREGVFVAPSQFETVFFSDAHDAADMNLVLEAYRKGLRAVLG